MFKLKVKFVDNTESELTDLVLENEVRKIQVHSNTYTYLFKGNTKPQVGSFAIVKTPYGVKKVIIKEVSDVDDSDKDYKEVLGVFNYSDSSYTKVCDKFSDIIIGEIALRLEKKSIKQAILEITKNVEDKDIKRLAQLLEHYNASDTSTTS